MKKIITLIGFIGFLSCLKEKRPVPDLCLLEKMETFKKTEEAVSIKTRKIGKETHYWFNTNATHWDGIEYILNEACDTVCIYCGRCHPPDCVKDYPLEGWKTIWQK